MKIFTRCTIALLLIFLHGKGFCQYNDYNTYYYNYFSTLASSNEVGESAASDAQGNVYVAGERSKELTVQDVHIIKYSTNGNSTSVDYINSTYKEYVKKILVNGSNVYVICDAVNISTNQSVLLVLRYNTNLKLMGSSILSSYSAPTDACLDDSSNVFISCYKDTLASSDLEVIKLNSSLSVSRTYAYHYQSVSDAYTENPLDIYYNTYDKSVYVAGNILSPTNLSATLLLKLTSGSDALAWKKIYPFSAGKNSFNSVRASSSLVYAAGCGTDSVNKTYMQLKSYNYYGKTSKTYSFYDKINGKKNFQSTEAFAVTLAQTFGIRVVSISKDSANKKCNVILSFIKPNLSSATDHKVAMPYNTTIGDAATNQQSLDNIITGYKPAGSNKNMFLLAFDEGGALGYSDSIISRNACGNSIVFPDAWNAWVTGFQDLKSSFSLPDDECFTRHYFDTGVIGFNRVSADEINMMKNNNGNNQITIFPNPAHDKININSVEAIKDIKLYNIAGSLVLHQDVQTQNTFQCILNINLLPAGAYVVKINDEKTYKVLKE